jgi:hypothetical protein
MKTRSEVAVLCLALAACGVPDPPQSTGGVRLGQPDATPYMDGSSRPRCGRAIVVDESDYTSTNVALLDLEGRVLSGSIASSRTTSVGLAAPLSGDVMSPTMPVGGSELVLVDGSSTASRIVWVDPVTAARRELSVATGFWSDPHDYARISGTKAYVTRFNANATPGRQPLDSGSDVLVIDPSRPAVVRSIDLVPAMEGDAALALPRPDKIVLRGARAFVLLEALAPDFSAAVPSRVATIDTDRDTLTSVVTLEGFRNCAGLALSPTGDELAVLCSGTFDPSRPSDLAGSGVVVVDIAGEPRVKSTFRAADLGQNPVGFFCDFSSPTALVLETFGHSDPTGPGADDELLRLDLETGAVEVILRSAGEPFTIGGVACDVACGVCFVADAARDGGVVHRFRIGADGRLSAGQAIKVERNPGLPPRYLGKL